MQPNFHSDTARKSVAERALELAHSGVPRNLREIEIQLRADGYQYAGAYLMANTLRKQIRAACVAATKVRV